MAPKKDGGPKKGKTAWIIFSTEQRPSVKAAHPELSFGEIAKELGRQWKEIDPATKAKYEALAKQDSARYEKEKANMNGKGRGAAADDDDEEEEDDDDEE